MNKLSYSILILISFTLSSFAAQGPATVFKITMEKIELCTGVTVTTTGDEHDTTCNGAVTVGTGSSTFDIASVTAGQQVGTFVSTSGLPIGNTFTHARPTMSRTFKVKGYAEIDSNCFCRTVSGATYSSSAGKYKSVIYGKCESSAADAIANAEENTFYLGTDTSSGTTVCLNSACSSTSTTSYAKDTTSLNYLYGLAISDPNTATDNFNMIFKLESAYTVGITAPKMDLSFGTQTSVSAEETIDGSACFVEAYYPKVQVSFSD